MSFCPHCHSGHDPVLVQSTWSCGVRYNDPSWRTKECYKRNLELANERIKRLEEALGCAIVKCHYLHHRKNHQHRSGEPCPVEALIRKAMEAKP